MTKAKKTACRLFPLLFPMCIKKFKEDLYVP
jgi:hypothetical protein